MRVMCESDGRGVSVQATCESNVQDGRAGRGVVVQATYESDV